MKKLIFGLTFMLGAFASTAQNFSLPIEGNVGYINFHDDSNFRDTWYAGGSTGFDFGENAGIRGYYWRALQDGETTKFDNLEIYGAESKVKVPITQQVKPYLVVGGGLLKPFGNYVDANNNWENDSHFFGSAGAGLDLKFIRFISMTGYARAMVSDFSQINTLENDIQTSWNYGASINFNIGDKGIKRKAVATPEPIVMPAAPAPQVDTQQQIDEQLEEKAKEDKIAELERRIQQLEEEKRRAEEREQLKRELREELMKEYEFKREIRKQLPVIEEEIEIIEVPTTDEGAKKKITDLTDQNVALENSIAELREQLAAKEQESIEKMQATEKATLELKAEIEKLEAEKQRAAEANINAAEIAKLESTINALNQKVEDLEVKRATESTQGIDDIEKKIAQLESERTEISKRKENQYRVEMARLQRQLELEREINKANQQVELPEVVETETVVEEPLIELVDREFLLATQDSVSRDEFKTMLEATEVGEGDSFGKRLFYTHTDGFLAGGFGTDSYAEPLIGVRPNFLLAGSKFRIAPEASVGFGNGTSVNVLANALYDINANESNFKPYVGGGAGFIMPNGEFKPAINLAVGSQLRNVLNGKLTAEIASRNLFKYNQLSVGYEIF